VINTLPTDTHDYLMDCFWQYYNSVIHVVHKAAIEDDREHGGQFYSGYLHVCILALGFRNADKSRPDIMRISMPNRESTLHYVAKFMLDYEIEQPTGIPLIAALLLLGDLECGVGRDSLGWLYAGMANRLCFDIGLHLDRSKSGFPKQDIQIGRMTLLACVIYDKYWALFLGRPTGLKSSDLETYNLTEQFTRLGRCLPATSEKSLETQVYESLLDLMEIAGKITEIDASRLDDNVNPNHHVFVLMANLNRELELWYTRLPKPLQWTPENVRSAPFSFFLLHQQYHVTIILLHRPFAKHGDSQPPNPDNIEDCMPQPNMHLSSMSRTICTQHAVRVAQIFWQHRERFNTKKIFVTGLQHAGTAAIALVAALGSLKDSSSRDANMHYLETLAAALEDMTETYQPAERMSAVLKAVIVELKATLPQSRPEKIVPARRERGTIDDDMPRPAPSKRHQSFRASPPLSPPHNTLPRPQPNPTPPIHETDPNLFSTSDDHMPPRTGLGCFVVVDSQIDDVNLDGAWPSPTNADTSALDYPMFTSSRSLNTNTSTPTVSPLPGSRNFVFQPSDYQNIRPPDERLGAHCNSLDFFSILSSDRGGFSGLRDKDGNSTLLAAPTVTQANAFPARSSTEATKPPSIRKESASSKISDSAAQTMANLQDLLDKMRGSSQSS
jgi:Fungal specific transcription factor domain